MSVDLIPAVNEIRNHADAYQLAEDYYHGEVGELFTSAAVQRALRGASSGFDVNLACRPVDAVLDRLEIIAISVPGEVSATRWLVDNIWTPNKMDRDSKLVHWAALTYGDSYLIVWPGEEDNVVEMYYNSPISVRVFYSPENPRIKSHAAKMWTEGYRELAFTRVDLYYPDRIEKYTTKPGNRGTQLSDFEPYELEDEPWPLPNPYGQVPVFHFRPSRSSYGRPEHRNAFGPQNAITKLSTTLMATIDYQGFPQRYALLQATSADTLFAPDIDDETSAPTPGTTDLKASPGTVWRLPDTTKVGQFDPANVEAFLNPLNFYARAMAASTATPLRFLEPSGDVPSGEALRADDAPLAKRIFDRQALFAPEWSAALRFAASLLGQQLPEIDVQWEPVQTVDDKTGWETVLLKVQAGVPVRQALVETGYLSDLVEGWLEAPVLESNIPARDVPVLEGKP